MFYAWELSVRFQKNPSVVEKMASALVKHYMSSALYY